MAEEPKDENAHTEEEEPAASAPGPAAPPIAVATGGKGEQKGTKVSSDINPTSMASIEDPRKPGEQIGVIAFYFPGRSTPWDARCGAGFLGNFWRLPSGNEITYDPPSFLDRKFTFNNAEAAFQALKYWDKYGKQFEPLSGGQAFDLKKKLMKEAPDFTYGGNGNNWLGMLAILRKKFQEGSEMAEALKMTGDNYLLEHNERSGRDKVWSDNLDGTGTNWLGLQVMILREELQHEQEKASSWTKFVEPLLDVEGSGAPYDGGAEKWQDVVMRATMAVVQA